MQGLIIKAIGGIYTVETKTEAQDASCCFECSARGIFRKKNISPCCGDLVEISETAQGEGIIEEIFPRKSEIIRPPLANLDILAFVASTAKPVVNLPVLDKFIAVAEYKKIEPIVIFTKADLCDPAEIAEIYKNSGIKTFIADKQQGYDQIKQYLSGKLCAFTGNTGVGKSTLLNNMYPNLELKTAEISKKLGRGKHTTRHVELFPTSNGGYIADTPGFSSFDTNRYDIIFKDELAGCFREFAPFVDKCKFPDCSHTKEKGCAVIDAVNDGIIPKTRHESYVQMYENAKQLKEWEHKKP